MCDVNFEFLFFLCVRFYYFHYYFVRVHLLIKSECLIFSSFLSFLSMEIVSFFFLFADELLAEKEKYKGVSDELDMTLNELSGY